MHEGRSHPLLQQTALSVNPFVDLPKPPTLPHNYATLPSTLPPSAIHATPTAANSDLPAYVTSSSGFAAHPSTITAQNRALLDRLDSQAQDARRKVEAWEQEIRDRELAEKRRKAPGWLDSEARILEPEKAGGRGEEQQQVNLMDDSEPKPAKSDRQSDDLGAAMDRAFGKSDLE